MATMITNRRSISRANAPAMSYSKPTGSTSPMLRLSMLRRLRDFAPRKRLELRLKLRKLSAYSMKLRRQSVPELRLKKLLTRSALKPKRPNASPPKPLR